MDTVKSCLLTVDKSGDLWEKILKTTIFRGALGSQDFTIKAHTEVILSPVYPHKSAMKTLIFILLIAFVSAAPPATKSKPRSDSDGVTVLSRSFSNDGNAYQFAFEQSDGQKREEQGEIKVRA